MTIDELINGMNSAKWFSRLGEFPPRQGRFVGVPDLTLWAAVAILELLPSADPYVPHDQEFIERFAPMICLNDLDAAEDETGSELRNASKEVELNTTQLAELRRLMRRALNRAHEHPLLVVGPHRFLGAAKLAAVYAVERAAGEIKSEVEGPWSEIVALFFEGYWPMGVLPSGEIVVL